MNKTTSDNPFVVTALSALKSVIDPEIGLNVVDLGLIYEIDIDEDNRKLYCTTTLTSQFCPMGESILEAENEALQASFPDYQIVLNITYIPAWIPEMISPAGREYLNR